MNILHKMKTLARRWCHETEGLAAMEAAFVFPILLTLLLGTFDMGNAILSNQKAIRSSQVVADLITRARSVDQSEINEAVQAGQLAFETLDSSSYGVDIVSIRFDEDSNAEIVWRETRNMTPKADVLTDVASLAEDNGGVMVVTVEYTFEPLFGDFVIDEFVMQETAFARGRKSAVVARD